MDPNTIGAELMKNPQFMEMFQKALGDGKIPDDKDPNREKWLKEMQSRLQQQQKEEVKRKLETPVTDAEGTWMWIVPEPGFCVKCSTTTGGKVFINITQHQRIAEPIPMPEEEQEDDDSIKFKIPLSCGQARQDVDKSGRPCTVYDVIVNPNTIKRCGEDNEFRRFLAALCMTWIKQKSEPKLNADEFKNVNFKCKGVPDPQRIRLASPSETNNGENALKNEIKLPENKASASAPKLQGGSSGKKLVQEITPTSESRQKEKEEKTPAKPQPSVTVDSAGSYLWSAKHPRPTKSPYFRESVPDRFIITAILPGISTIKEIDVQIKPRRVDFFGVDEVEEGQGKPFFSIPLKYPVSDEPLHAKFVRATHTLTLHLEVSLPTADRVESSRDAAEIEAEELAREEAESQRRIAEQKAKFERMKKEEEEVMKQRKEWVSNLSAVREGALPPSLVEDVNAMPKEQQQIMLVRLEQRIKKGDSVDELLEKMPADALAMLCRHLRTQLGLEVPPEAPSSNVSQTKNTEPTENWEDKLKADASSDTIEYNFAKKAERLFGVEMNNRYLFALDH